ncbi:unnamed protein product [Hapterophycus canaliculatus]
MVRGLKDSSSVDERVRVRDSEKPGGGLVAPGDRDWDSRARGAVSFLSIDLCPVRGVRALKFVISFASSLCWSVEGAVCRISFCTTGAVDVLEQLCLARAQKSEGSFRA